VIAATMCGTTPRIRPNAATMPALEPRDMPGADGVHRTGAGRGDHHEGGQQKGNAHRSNLPVRALLRHTLLAVFGALAEWDAAVAKGAGSAERPAKRRDRACAASGPTSGRRPRLLGCPVKCVQGPLNEHAITTAVTAVLDRMPAAPPGRRGDMSSDPQFIRVLA
jgi:hypothetical protein